MAGSDSQPEFGPMQGSAAQPQFGPMPGNAAGSGPDPFPGNAAGPGAFPGNAAGPGPLPGAAAQPQSGPTPGWAGQPRARNWQGGGGARGLGDFIRGDSSVGDDLAGLAVGAAARFIGRAISRRVQQKVTDQVLPAAAARGQELLRAQVEIAQRHPDLRACLNDQVIFLAGGSRALPMSELHGMPTVEQADALVARLRNG